MNWILILIPSLVVLVMIWFIMQYKRASRKDQQIFDEYFKDKKI